MTNYLRLNISMYNEYRHYLLIMETYLTIEIFLEAHLSITKKLCTRSSKENLKIPHAGCLPLEYGRHFFKKSFPVGKNVFGQVYEGLFYMGETINQIMPRRVIHKCILQRSEHCKSESFPNHGGIFT